MKHYISVQDASDKALSFAHEGLQGLYRGERATFVGGVDEWPHYGVGYTGNLLRPGVAPDEFQFTLQDVVAERARRHALRVKADAAAAGVE